MSMLGPYASWNKGLRDVNQTLWNVEDELRVHESDNNFDEEFVRLARLVYHTNDIRFSFKSEINKITNRWRI